MTLRFYQLEISFREINHTHTISFYYSRDACFLKVPRYNDVRLNFSAIKSLSCLLENKLRSPATDFYFLRDI